jgi:hypothetical protein
VSDRTHESVPDAGMAQLQQEVAAAMTALDDG